MAIVFSKSSGAANNYWNESADMIQMKMKVLQKIWNVPQTAVPGKELRKL